MSSHSFLENTLRQERFYQKKSIDSASALRTSAPKQALRPPLFKVVFAVLGLMLFFYPADASHEKHVEQKNLENTPHSSEAEQQDVIVAAQKESQGSPVRLKIPTINVDTVIENVGLTSEGAMAVPDSTINVGWFDLGPRPGEKGSAVIAGHFNGKHGERGVFADLSKLKEGDRLSVEDGQGILTTFVVRESQSYDPGYADDVFRQSNSAHLNLITCSGEWDRAKKSYSNRLVVFADIVPKSLSLK